MLEEPEAYANAIERFLGTMNRITKATGTAGGGQ
jgi:hypothetical protein